MAKNKKEKFTNELIALCKEHKIINWGFCGEENNKFFGLTGNGYYSVINVGRLWQSAREQTKTFLDSFEGKWNK